MSTLTPDDVAEFGRHLREWQVQLGLQDWRIVFSPKEAKGCMASMSDWDWRQRQVTCRLGFDWKATPITTLTKKQTAVHELLHVLLYELITTAQQPGVSEETIASIEHRVINTLERLLVPIEE
jgi:hypothetical protein